MFYSGNTPTLLDLGYSFKFVYYWEETVLSCLNLLSLINSFNRLRTTLFEEIIENVILSATLFNWSIGLRFI